MQMQQNQDKNKVMTNHQMIYIMQQINHLEINIVTVMFF